MAKKAAGPQTCRVCGVTDENQLGRASCIARSGQPFKWVGPDLCNACEPIGKMEDALSIRASASYVLVKKLTPREFEVFELIARGMPQRAVAEKLGISTKTLDIHRTNVRHELEEHTIHGIPRHFYLWQFYKPIGDMRAASAAEMAVAP